MGSWQLLIPGKVQGRDCGVDGRRHHASYTAAFNGYRTVHTENLQTVNPLEAEEPDAELSRIKNSNMWHWANRYYRLRDTLLPKESAIRKFVKKIYDGKLQ